MVGSVVATSFLPPPVSNSALKRKSRDQDTGACRPQSPHPPVRRRKTTPCSLPPQFLLENTVLGSERAQHKKDL